MALNREKEIKVASGWPWLIVVIVIFAACIALFITAGVSGGRSTMGGGTVLGLVIAGVVLFIAGVLLCPGFFTLEPNETRVGVLFGHYKGTVRQGGFRWANPFWSNGPAVKASDVGMSADSVSVRARTLNGPLLKVNDKRGNPVEIAAVVVWRVQDTAQAVFDVEDFERYVHTQSETSLRHLAGSYTYDHGDENEITLRSNVDEVSQALKAELEQRFALAGVVVEEARLTHLAYAPEIAQAMLRRQQAEAIIDARQKIVHGAVSMVGMALHDLSEAGVVDLDYERKAAMVSNLMVVLCGESEVHPVVNTGTLYT